MPSSSLISVLQHSFSVHADRASVQEGDRVLSYADLDRLSARLASQLAVWGVTAGARVPVLIPRSMLLVVTQVALVRLGAAYAPIDLSSPASRRRQMVATTGGPICLLGSLDHVRIDADDVGGGPVHDLGAWWSRCFSAPADDSGHTGTGVGWDRAYPDGAPAYVMFTSGSTGVPKAVLVPDQGIVRLVRQARYAQFEPGQRWAFMSSPAFDASTLEVWGPLLNGGCCVVQAAATPGLDELGAFLRDQRISDAWLTSALFSAMVEDQLDALGGLTQLLTGGDRVSPSHARRCLAAHPALRLINGYGPTENTTFTLAHTVTPADTLRADGIPIGSPIDGTVVRLHETSADGVGELWAGGAGVALGYLNDAALTAEKFVNADGQRWYRTGDLARLDPSTGLYSFVGRVDRQVKIRGHRVELDEVEAVLAACPGVGEVAALVIDAAQSESAQLIAYVSLSDAGTVQALRQHLSASLPPAAHPSAIHTLVRLPRTSNGKTDRKALLALWALQRPATATDTRFAERLQRRLSHAPEHPALVTAHQTLSYAELDRRSASLAAELQRQGVRAGHHVPVLLPRGLEFVVAALAIVRCGAVYVPIDLASPAQRLQHIFDVLQPALLLMANDDSGGTLACAVPGACRVLGVVGRVNADGPDALTSVPWVPRLDSDALYAMFTSGTTGLPKCVVLPAAGLIPLLSANALADYPADARWLMAASLAFDASAFELWAALLHGATLVVQDGALPSLDQLAGLITTQRVSHALLTTSMFNALVDLHLPSLGGIKQLLTGGERASASHMRRLLQAHPHVRLLNAYGPTEVTIAALMRPVTLADTLHAGGVPIGSPVPQTELRLDVGPDVSPPAPDDAPARGGELLIAGPGLALGYLNDAAQTAAKFVQRDGRRWYRTGDLVRRRSDDCYEFLGRVDRQVKLQGQRFELDEVELALAACPGVGEVMVLERAADDAASHHLAACYTGLGGATPPAVDGVAAFVASRLPQAAVPRRWLTLSRLPTTVNGKVDVAALAHALDTQTDAPTPCTDAADGAPTAPAVWHTTFESDLAAIWAELLPHARLHPQSNFLRVGGTSLLALHVSALVGRRLGRQLSPVQVLRYPVLADQAQQLRSAVPAPAPWTPATTDGETRVPVTLAQGAQSLLAATALDPTGSAYLVHVPLLLAQWPDVAPWARAMVALAERHPLLRLRAHLNADAVDAWLEPHLVADWLQTYEAIDRPPTDLAWPQHLLDLLNRPLDTARDGVMRVDLFPLREGGALWVWTLHHCVIDEASVDQALADLHHLLSGEVLPPVDGSSLGWAQLETAWTQGEALDTMAQQLAAALGNEAPRLPAAPAPGGEWPLPMPSDLQAQVLRWSEAAGVTPFPLLLSAYGQALQAVFGEAYRFVATPFSRRTEPELVEPLAYWIDVRLLEAGARPGETAGAACLRVMRQVQDAQAPGFQSLGQLASRWAGDPQRTAQLTPHLTQFAFTWRLDSERELNLGTLSARLLRVPQQTARYSLCLHVARVDGQMVCSIEAVQLAHDNGVVAAVGQAFQQALSRLCRDAAATDSAAPSPDASAGSATEPLAPAAPHDCALRESWSRWLCVSIDAVSDASHFLRQGGSSLTAMRMAAQLRREHGLRLDVAAFLRSPTFGVLRCLAAAAPDTQQHDCVVVGPTDAQRVLLMVPGFGGQVASLYGLAREVHRRVPKGTAVAIVDLDRLLAGVAEESVAKHAMAVLEKVAAEWGRKRLIGVVGFSLGGLLALQLAKSQAVGCNLPVCLLDTYAPRNRRPGLLRRVERVVAHRLWPFVPDTLSDGGDDAELAQGLDIGDLDSLQPQTPSATWSRLMQQLEVVSCRAQHVPVQLIQASKAVVKEGLLWRRRSNGFVPSDYASFHVHNVDAAHLDLPRELASVAAGLIADQWAAPAAAGPR